MSITGTRTFLELCVGKHHVAEVVLYVRREDMAWFNASATEHREEVFELLTNSILPRMCGDELEIFYHKKYPRRFPLEIGSKNMTAANNAKNNRRKLGKRSKKEIAAQKQLEEGKEDGKKIKDIYYAFSENLHVAYKTEDIEVYDSATLLFTSSISNNNDSASNAATGKAKTKSQRIESNSKAGSGGFQHMTKLSKRFLLWCYETKGGDIDNDDKDKAGGNDEEPDGVAAKSSLQQPEFVPTDQLFRPEPEKKETKPKKRRKR